MGMGKAIACLLTDWHCHVFTQFCSIHSTNMAMHFNREPLQKGLVDKCASHKHHTRMDGYRKSYISVCVRVFLRVPLLRVSRKHQKEDRHPPAHERCVHIHPARRMREAGSNEKAQLSQELNALQVRPTDRATDSSVWLRICFIFPCWV